MLRIDPKWQEDASSLLQRSLQSDDPHLRVRFMALHFVASGDPASLAALKVGKHRVTVSEWVRKFNESGPQGLESNWKGNEGRILTEEEFAELKEAVRHHPRQVGIKKGRWTAKTVAAYVKKVFGKKIHHDTARKYLHLLGFRHRKPDKNLVKADPEEQKEFADDLEKTEKERCPGAVTVYVDEGSIQQDSILRKGWFLEDELPVVDSTSPGKKKSFSMPQ
jgi:transposase